MRIKNKKICIEFFVRKAQKIFFCKKEKNITFVDIKLVHCSRIYFREND
ncbi:hypothetical protein SAMN05444380_10728 [Thermophagus xiamenensis]|jgi:hypothetical protein|uniref:Uncharacterized protein n=1 Tax=Thermophagus xiamenensis TaxID=385682 RepID=A0A1I1Y4W7_9BACT|nr:hypothetical protein SAMN05444380_10728 [Thermophagus xiamenensis]